MKKKNKIVVFVLLGIAAWLVYFDVASYVNFRNTYAEYEKVLRKYRDTEKKLNQLNQELKELHLQIANDRHNVSQAGTSTSR